MKMADLLFNIEVKEICCWCGSLKEVDQDSDQWWANIRCAEHFYSIPDSKWDRVLHSKQSISLPSYKHWVYRRCGFVTATLVLVPNFRDVIPWKSVRIQQSCGEAYCFSWLYVECHRTADIFMKLKHLKLKRYIYI